MSHTNLLTSGGGHRIRFGIRWDGGPRPHARLFVLLGIALAGAGASAARAEAQTSSAAKPAPLVIVAAEPGRQDAARRLVGRLGGTVRHPLAILEGFSARVPAGSVRRLRRSPAVRVVTLDAPLRVSSTDPGTQTALASTDVVRQATSLGALDASTALGSGVGVALIDTGVMRVGGLAEAGRVVYGPDLSSESGNSNLRTLDTFGHGTHMAGVIAGRDALTGFAGVAPGARVISLKVADAYGKTTLERVLRAFDWIGLHKGDPGVGIRVVNLSLGAYDSAGYTKDALAVAAEKLWFQGITVVAAAGNTGAQQPLLDMPAADPYVIAVGATDTRGTADPADDRVAEFSSRSATRPPDVVAPGTGIVSLRVPGSTLDLEYPSARVGDGFFRGSGTSQATAVVSGIAARLLAQRPSLAPDQVKALLVKGAVNLPDDRSADGAGRVDAARAAATATPLASVVRQTWTRAGTQTTSGGLLGGLVTTVVGVVGSLVGTVGLGWVDPGTGQVVDGTTEWTGRRWSGRRWSGSSWTDAPAG